MKIIKRKEYILFDSNSNFIGTTTDVYNYGCNDKLVSISRPKIKDSFPEVLFAMVEKIPTENQIVNRLKYANSIIEKILCK